MWGQSVKQPVYLLLVSAMMSLILGLWGLISVTELGGAPRLACRQAPLSWLLCRESWSGGSLIHGGPGKVGGEAPRLACRSGTPGMASGIT